MAEQEKAPVLPGPFSCGTGAAERVA